MSGDPSPGAASRRKGGQGGAVPAASGGLGRKRRGRLVLHRIGSVGGAGGARAGADAPQQRALRGRGGVAVRDEEAWVQEKGIWIRFRGKGGAGQGGPSPTPQQRRRPRRKRWFGGLGFPKGNPGKGGYGPAQGGWCRFPLQRGGGRPGKGGPGKGPGGAPPPGQQNPGPAKGGKGFGYGWGLGSQGPVKGDMEPERRSGAPCRGSGKPGGAGGQGGGLGQEKDMVSGIRGGSRRGLVKGLAQPHPSGPRARPQGGPGLEIWWIGFPRTRARRIWTREKGSWCRALRAEGERSGGQDEEA
ncbi:hypothetical protein HNY73_014706 [Argiope bruennichi]|uniref:Uncharacterized protein n=1 Tax=Argiope bruennichi TaxID=94029 RepID=A0A8T0EU68_ARGBR|nr:hypothetical protein HNY73_014706 [Argiope bruennichi]